MAQKSERRLWVVEMLSKLHSWLYMPVISALGHQELEADLGYLVSWRSAWAHHVTNIQVHTLFNSEHDT